MAGNSQKWLEMAKMAENRWKRLDMTRYGNGWNGWKWLKMAGNDWNDWKWPEMAEMAGKG